MRITVHEFRRACDTLVRFTQEDTRVTDEERNLIVMVVRALEQTLAPSYSLDARDRRSLGRKLIKHSLIG